MDPQTEPDVIPTYESEPRIIWIGDRDAWDILLNDLDNIPKFKPCLFNTLEGNCIGDESKISTMHFYNAMSYHFYLIDVYWLGAITFWRTNKHNTFLKNVLESENIIKVFFDVKKYSEVLYRKYRTKPAGVHDLQLTELATSENPY
ncbi:hypothetical protein F52700_2865 [Fusarium sp. NRRL 52700]|nr:hypothetical protein F52700_2865 [Fusarium sp. NRRL 52700]